MSCLEYHHFQDGSIKDKLTIVDGILVNISEYSLMPKHHLRTIRWLSDDHQYIHEKYLSPDGLLIATGTHEVDILGRISFSARRGIRKRFDSQGRLINVNECYNFKFDGLGVGYYISGQKRIEHNFVDGFVEGQSISYHKNGNVCKMLDFKRGKLDGQVKEYNQYGELIEMSFFKNDKSHGVYYSYHPNGLIQRIKFYQNGASVGKIIEFNDDGSFAKMEDPEFNKKRKIE